MPVLTNASTDPGQKKIVHVRTIGSQVLQIVNGLSPTDAGPSDDQPERGHVSEISV
jgi:hypothetical protein